MRGWSEVGGRTAAAALIITSSHTPDQGAALAAYFRGLVHHAQHKRHRCLQAGRLAKSIQGRKAAVGSGAAPASTSVLPHSTKRHSDHAPHPTPPPDTHTCTSARTSISSSRPSPAGSTGSSRLCQWKGSSSGTSDSTMPLSRPTLGQNTTTCGGGQARGQRRKCRLVGVQGVEP